MGKSTLLCVGTFRLIILTVRKIVEQSFFGILTENLDKYMSPHYSFHVFAQLKRKEGQEQTLALS